MNLLKGTKRDIAVFLVKVIAIYVFWYVLYHGWLLPDGRLDLFVSRNIVSVTANLLQISGYEVFTFDRMIGIGPANGLEIIDGCNGIETIGLFIGFVVAYPGSNVRRWLFIPTGMILIYLVNVLRIYFLAIIQYHWFPGFQINHDYTFTLIFYLVVIAMCVIWALFGEAKPLDQPQSA